MPLSKVERQEAMLKLVEKFINVGFEEFGETSQVCVRIPTQACPVYGRGGGKLTNFSNGTGTLEKVMALE